MSASASELALKVRKGTRLSSAKRGRTPAPNATPSPSAKPLRPLCVPKMQTRPGLCPDPPDLCTFVCRPLCFRGVTRLLSELSGPLPVTTTFSLPFFLVRSLLPASSLPGHMGRGRLIRPQGHELLISYQARREPSTVTHMHGRGGSQRAQRVWGNQNRCPRFGHLRPTGP